MFAKEYNFIDDFFIKKRDEVNMYFNNQVSCGFSKNSMRGSTAKDLFEITIKNFFKCINEELTTELNEYRYKNKFDNSLKSYKKNIIEIKQEILKYLDKYLENYIRTQKEIDYIYQVLNIETNNSIKKWSYIIEKKRKPILMKFKDFLELITKFIHI